MKRGVSVAMVGLSVASATACSTIYDLDKYTTGDAASPAATAVPTPTVPFVEAGVESGNDSGAPADEAGPCRAAVSPGVGGACTNAICVPFDNGARIPGYVADAAPPPLPEAGTPATSGAVDGGGPADSSVSEASTVLQTALPACSNLPNPVYVIGSSGLTGLAAELGQLAASVPITVVFVAARSCDSVKAIILGTSALDLGATTATYWDVTGTAQLCQIDDASKHADIGLGQLFADACLSLPQGTSGVGDFLGPVTPIDMVVPTASTQTSISAEALYYTFGVGAAVAPWTDPSVVFFNPGSGPQYDVSVAIGVPVAQWKGTKVTTAAQNIAKVGTSSEPESTLGMMGADLVEAASNTSTIRAIAYQDVGQSCGYYPNVTPTSSEKQNVRDGHYPLWGYSHMFARVDAQNVPLNHDAATLINFFTGNQQTPSGNFLNFVINDHLVPVCAMRVTRSTEMGRLTPFAPGPSCGCYFDSLTKGSSTCQACKVHADCPASASHCNLGYCETN